MLVGILQALHLAPEIPEGVVHVANAPVSLLAGRGTCTRREIRLDPAKLYKLSAGLLAFVNYVNSLMRGIRVRQCKFWGAFALCAGADT